MRTLEESLSARRAWIEIAVCLCGAVIPKESLSARRAWIEIRRYNAPTVWRSVALRKESVDRNHFPPIVRYAAVGRSPQGERG